MTSQRIAFVIEEYPYAGRNGYSTYNRAFLEYFLKEKCEVHLYITGPRLPGVIFRDQAIEPTYHPTIHYLHAKKLRKLWIPSTISSLMRGLHSSLSSKVQARIRHFLRVLKDTSQGHSVSAAAIGRLLTAKERQRLARQVDLIHADWVFVDTIFRASFLPLMESSPRTALVAHDVFFQRCQSLEAQGISATPRVDAAFEADMLNQFDQIIAISGDDAATLRSIAPSCEITTLMSPVEIVSSMRPDLTKNGKRLLYIGSRAYHNTQGLLWFLEHVWPKIIGVLPDIGLDVIGSVGDGMKGYPNVTFHGRVDDVAAIAGRANFAINPVLAGSGLKIKVLDYLSHGLPCITTQVGGLGFPSGEFSPICLCDSESSFAERVISWAKNDEEVRKYILSIPAYIKKFSLEDFEKNMKALLKANRTSISTV